MTLRNREYSIGSPQVSWHASSLTTKSLLRYPPSIVHASGHAPRGPLIHPTRFRTNHIYPFHTHPPYPRSQSPNATGPNATNPRLTPALSIPSGLGTRGSISPFPQFGCCGLLLTLQLQWLTNSNLSSGGGWWCFVGLTDSCPRTLSPAYPPDGLSHRSPPLPLSIPIDRLFLSSPFGSQI